MGRGGHERGTPVKERVRTRRNSIGLCDARNSGQAPSEDPTGVSRFQKHASPLGSHSTDMSRALRGLRGEGNFIWGGGRFHTGEVPLYSMAGTMLLGPTSNSGKFPEFE